MDKSYGPHPGGERPGDANDRRTKLAELVAAKAGPRARQGHADLIAENERLRADEAKIAELEAHVANLKAENAALRADLDSTLNEDWR